jgi:hypothetical protein
MVVKAPGEPFSTPSRAEITLSRAKVRINFGFFAQIL